MKVLPVGLLVFLPILALAQTTIQAEDAALFGAFVRTDYAGYTGSGYVDVIDTYVESTGSYFEFVFRRATAAADTITMVYANGGSSRSFSVKVNDVAAGTITLPATGSWSTWSSQSVVLSLQAGVNRLRFTTSTKAAYPNVDRIVIGGQESVLMFRLSLTKSGNGTVSSIPSAGYLDAGSTVELSATPAGVSFFKRWMGAGDSPASPYVLTMNGHKTVVGVFRDTTGTAGFVYEPAATAFASVNALGNNGTTGGAGGDTVTVTSGDDLWNLMLLRTDAAHALNLRPLTVFVAGILSPGPVIGATQMLSVKDAYDISIIGVGDDATITNFGLNINRAKNVIVRNITFASCPDDGIAVEANDSELLGHHVWIDHCTFTDVPPPGYPAGSTPDGALDVTHTAAYVTISWCKFTKHDKTCLMGHSDSQSSDIAMKVTYHHNYFDSTTQRHPRVRFGKAHIYNNYYRKNHIYGVSSNLEADVVVEGSYFLNVPIPVETSRDGSPPGDLVERSNIFVSCGPPGTRGTAFDPTTFYSYSMDSAVTIPSMLTSYAGSGRYDFSYGGTAATYTLSVTATNGTVTKVPDQPTYAFGTSVQLTAAPSPGYYFVKWTGDVAPSQAFTNPVTITMDGNKSVTALFTNVLHTLTVNATNGTVTKNPDLAAYPEGTTVQLTPVPSPGYFFVNWTGNVPVGHEADNPLTLTMDANRNVTATFSGTAYTLTTIATHGSVLRNPNQAVFDSGATVQLTAVPDAGYHFTTWSGDASGSANPLSLLMNGNKTVTANVAINQYTLSITAVNGSVTRSPDQPFYDHGTTVTLTAVASPGFLFSSWSGGASGTGNPATVLMDGNKSVTANFTSVGSIVQSNGSGGGDWNTPATWLGGLVPTSTHTAVIQGSDSVRVASAASCSSVVVTSGGKLSAAAALTVSGAFTLEAGAFFYYSASVSLVLPGTSQSLHPSSTVVFNTVNTSAGTIPGTTYGNLVIQRDGNTTPDAPLTVQGNLTLRNTSGTKVFRGTSGSTSRTNTVHGNLLIYGGTLSCIDNGSGTAVAVWNIDGDVLISGTTNSRMSPFTTGATAGVVGLIAIGGNLHIEGGRLAYASNNSTGGIGMIRLAGDMAVDGGSSITDNGSLGPFVFNFNGIALQTVTLGMNFTMGTTIIDTVKAGSTVVFDNAQFTWGSTASAQSAFLVQGALELKDSSSVSGAGSFAVGSGATLTLGGSAGITASDTIGNIRVAGTRSFDSDAHYVYGGSVAQVTGNGLPALVQDLTVNNSHGVMLQSPVTVGGMLRVQAGMLDLNGNTVTLGPSALLSETSGHTVGGISGVITTTRTLNAPVTTTDIAGMGLRIGSAANLGATVIARGHAAQGSAGTGSIRRFFDIAPAVNTGLDATLVFGYDDAERDSIAEASLVLYRSTDGGTTWSDRGGAVSTAANTITVAGVDAFSRWTAAPGAGSPALTVTPVSLNFGSVPLGGSAVDTIRLLSAGALTLTVDSVRTYGGQFSCSLNGPVTLPAGDSLKVGVTFAPTVLAPQQGMVVVFGNAPTSPDTVLLAGRSDSGMLTVPVPVATGWNLVANPVTTTANAVAELFPTAAPPRAFLFNLASGYESTDRLENGIGYWVKFPAAAVQPVAGEARTRDTIDVGAGWNLIGGVSCAVDTGSIVSMPGGIRSSPFYEYVGVYTGAGSLEPGKAYWVKMSAPGQLILSCFTVAVPERQKQPKELR
jgi:pectate lyase